ncbi:MAG: transglutaminase domain-containing protein [Candidatus Daviesbacteria bacterium]
MSKLKILLLAIFLFVFTISPPQVWAENEFSTSYDATYEIAADGQALVTQKITLKNLTSQYYASTFILTVGSTTITDLLASDGSGPLETSVEDKDNRTVITVKLNQQVAGENKEQTFTLKFKSKDFASSLGKTWEVNLPRIPENPNVIKYDLTLSVPIAFGDPTSVVPKPRSESQTYDRLFFTFNKDQLANSGISLNFGTTQLFDFNLKYHLENTSLFPVMTSVTLPPDTNYQDVLINRVTPEPINVTVNSDGNFLAWYKLSRRSNLDITIVGSAKLYIFPKEDRFQNLSGQKKQELIKADQYWEKSNPSIATTLAEIFKEGEPKANKEKAQLIYRYVVDHLKYDTQRLKNNKIERLGAVTALSNPDSAVCMEFTDLFIALARAANVPAVELDGFAYSPNPKLRPLTHDLLHSWPQFFDEEKGWVMVDPTWENTSGGVDYFNKFDLNHLVFAIKGTSSKLPFVSDDVKVTISKGDFLAQPKLDVLIDVPENIWSGLPAKATIKVVNQGNVVQEPATLTINSGKIKILESNQIQMKKIPPFGSTSYQLNLRTPNVWQLFNEEIEVNVAGQKFAKSVNVKPLTSFIPLPVFLVLVGAVILLVYGVILLLHVIRKKAPKTQTK